MYTFINPPHTSRVIRKQNLSLKVTRNEYLPRPPLNKPPLHRHTHRIPISQTQKHAPPGLTLHRHVIKYDTALPHIPIKPHTRVVYSNPRLTAAQQMG